MKYLKRDIVIDILNAAAAQAARENGARHPEDIASAMVNAIDGAAAALTIAARMDLFVDKAVE